MRNKVASNLFLSVIILIAKVCLMSDLWLIKDCTQMQKIFFIGQNILNSFKTVSNLADIYHRFLSRKKDML